MEHSANLYDVIRIDHFIGTVKYYAIPAEDNDARNGKWCKGPGMDLIKAIDESINGKSIIAEDLGVKMPEVVEVLEKSGYPGMKVLEFAFDGDRKNDHLPYNWIPNVVAYGGTHDNDTIQGWFASADPVDTEWAREYFRLTKEEGYHWGMMRALWGSVADTAIVQAQDLLGLGSEARMNEPSTVGRNWQWRALPGVFTEELAQKIHRMMVLYERVN